MFKGTEKKAPKKFDLRIFLVSFSWWIDNLIIELKLEIHNPAQIKGIRITELK